MNDAVMWNEGALDEGAADLQLAYQAISAEVNDLISDLDKNLADWAGGDQEAYRHAREIWRNELDDLNGVLTRMSTAVSEIKANYMQTENKNVTIFGG